VSDPTVLLPAARPSSAAAPLLSNPATCCVDTWPNPSVPLAIDGEGWQLRRKRTGYRHFSGPARAARLRGTGTSDEGFQHGNVVIVAFALNVAMAKSQLLRHRQAVHHSSVDQSLGESVLGIPERLLTFDIGLPTDALRVEDNGMEIDLTCAVRSDCNATRSPVRLHDVTMLAECLQQVIERQLGDVDGEIEIAVDPGLTANQCVDAPAAGNPDAVKPCRVGDTQHSPDLGNGHARASVVTYVRHHEAS
jgi:hypothetical protein